MFSCGNNFILVVLGPEGWTGRQENLKISISSIHPNIHITFIYIYKCSKCFTLLYRKKVINYTSNIKNAGVKIKPHVGIFNKMYMLYFVQSSKNFTYLKKQYLLKYFTSPYIIYFLLNYYFLCIIIKKHN